ncbi:MULTISPECIES: hypothetical protein [Streptomyces]|uniref:hypothetical protein n=1 Tax=Streptomyces TaxID=1883 RepID=UPI001CCC31FE|nr:MULTISPECIES: hypothetical protein [Streptomyces]UBI35305.1 hypothetical protein K7I03_01740 [Streptomyces mobaraensis]UKW27896.1 hypothetical protein MCU78_01775 [Streptomyces sp. TYQ1024]
MTTLRKKLLTGGAAALSGAALLLGAGLAQPAAAVDFPHAEVAYFAAGSDLTGRQAPVDITDTTCHNLAEPARSAVNFTTADIKVYYNRDCRTGLPDRPNDWYFGLGTLSWANFSFPALSYQVVRH